RRELFSNTHVENLLHMENGVMGIAFQTSAFIICNQKLELYSCSYKSIENIPSCYTNGLFILLFFIVCGV
ncbi:hypothetical protein ACUOCP_45155, partial [Escherichia sp. R-CC3]